MFRPYMLRVHLVINTNCGKTFRVKVAYKAFNSLPTKKAAVVDLNSVL